MGCEEGIAELKWNWNGSKGDGNGNAHSNIDRILEAKFIVHYQIHGRGVVIGVAGVVGGVQQLLGGGAGGVTVTGATSGGRIPTHWTVQHIYEKEKSKSSM